MAKALKKIENTIVDGFFFVVLFLLIYATLIWLKDLIWKSFKIDGIYTATAYFVLAFLLSISIISRHRQKKEDLKVFRD